jgi:hypothetical protein
MIADFDNRWAGAKATSVWGESLCFMSCDEIHHLTTGAEYRQGQIEKTNKVIRDNTLPLQIVACRANPSDIIRPKLFMKFFPNKSIVLQTLLHIL